MKPSTIEYGQPWFRLKEGPIEFEEIEGNFNIVINGWPNCVLGLERGPSAVNNEKIRPRGTLVYTIDDKKFHIHDGVTKGGSAHWSYYK